MLRMQDIFLSLHDTQHNDTQYNDIQHNETKRKGLILDTWHSILYHYAECGVLFVVMLSA